MAIVWNGVNAVQGGQCVYVMLHALTPHIANIPNVMGPGSALDSGGMIGFALFWVATCCFLIIPVPKVSAHSSKSREKPLTVIDERSRLCQIGCLHHKRYCHVGMDNHESWWPWSCCQSARYSIGLKTHLASHSFLLAWSSKLRNVCIQCS